MKDSPKLTPEEKELLRKHREFYRALETGERQPTTEAQRHFVEVCKGRAGARTPHERAYAKYMRIRPRGQTERQPAGGSGIPEYENGVPRPGWFSDEDWKKQRQRQYGDMKRRQRDG